MTGETTTPSITPPSTTTDATTQETQDPPAIDRRTRAYRHRGEDPAMVALRMRQRRAERRDIVKAQNRARRAANLALHRERDRAWYHGLSIEAYRALMARNACDVCGTSQRRLCIDHCHQSGRIRGLLCDRCNKGIGFFADDPGLMQAARTYLQSTRS